jgi:hypothetical protein
MVFPPKTMVFPPKTMVFPPKTSMFFSTQGTWANFSKAASRLGKSVRGPEVPVSASHFIETFWKKKNRNEILGYLSFRQTYIYLIFVGDVGVSSRFLIGFSVIMSKNSMESLLFLGF